MHCISSLVSNDLVIGKRVSEAMELVKIPEGHVFVAFTKDIAV